MEETFPTNVLKLLPIENGIFKNVDKKFPTEKSFKTFVDMQFPIDETFPTNVDKLLQEGNQYFELQILAKEQEPYIFFSLVRILDLW